VEVHYSVKKEWREQGVYQRNLDLAKYVAARYIGLMERTQKRSLIYVVSNEWLMVEFVRQDVDEFYVAGVGMVDEVLASYPPIVSVYDELMPDRYLKMEQHYLIFDGRMYYVEGFADLKDALSDLKEWLAQSAVSQRRLEGAIRRIDEIVGGADVELARRSAEEVFPSVLGLFEDYLASQVRYLLLAGASEGALAEYARRLLAVLPRDIVAKVFALGVNYADARIAKAGDQELRKFAEYLSGVQRLFRELGVDLEKAAECASAYLKSSGRPSAGLKL